MKIAIGSDHAGYAYKREIINFLEGLGIKIKDCGTNSEESCNYPDYAHAVAESIGEFPVGILICGSANGVAMTANKHAGVRAAYCWNEEITELTRQHNDANIICLPARFITLELAKNLVDIFLKTEFEGGRHQKRVDGINI